MPWGQRLTLGAAFRGQIASGEAPVMGFPQLLLLTINWYRAVHLLYLLLSVHVNVYSIQNHIFALYKDLPESGLPPGRSCGHSMAFF